MKEPPSTRISLKLPRPDLSAKEAVEVIHAHSADLIQSRQAFYVSSAGAADIRGRLAVGVGAWQIGLRNSSTDSCTTLSLVYSGVLSIRNHCTSGVAPPAFAVDSAWIDSTRAASAIEREPLPDRMGDHYSIFMSLKQVDDFGLLWEVRRTYADPPTGLHIIHSFAVHATSGEIVVERIRQEIDGRPVESRHRRGPGADEWTDELQRGPLKGDAH
jgi:hypothetical protein